MKKTLIIPLIALMVTGASTFGASLAFANGNEDNNGSDRGDSVKMDAHIGFWSKYFNDDNWPCAHPGLGRIFGEGWLKNHECSTSPDTTDPVIRSLDVTTTNTTATIALAASEPVSAVVGYDQDNSHGKIASHLDFSTNQTIIIRGLERNTKYHYIVTIRDRAGNVTMSNDKTFTTANDRPDTNNDAPVISDIQVVTTGTNRAEINWSTNERATSRIYYSKTSPLVIGNIQIASDTSLATDHSVTLSNLSSDTQYHYIVESVDTDSNISVSSEHSFTTNK